MIVQQDRIFRTSGARYSCIAEVGALAQRQAKYRYEQEEYGNLLSQNRDGSIFYHHFDALGSTRDLTDDAEVVTDTWLYRAYGKTESRTGTTVNPYQWIGKVGYRYEEETDNHHVRARTLRDGRFTSRDPARDDVNPYRYVRNAPTDKIDPSGLEDLNVDIDLLLKDLQQTPPDVARWERACDIIVYRRL